LGSRSTIAPTIIHVRPRCKVVFSTLNLDSPMRYIKKKVKKQKTKSNLKKKKKNNFFIGCPRCKVEKEILHLSYTYTYYC
jgi:hypothetical protein